MIKTSSAVCLAILLLICYLAMQLSHLWITWLLLLRLGFFPATLRHHLLGHHLLGATVLRIGFKVPGCLLLSMQEMITLAFSSIGDGSSIPASHPVTGQQLLPRRLSKTCMLLRWQCRHG
jgi:hypothetical protein